MALQVAVDVRLVTALAFAKELGRFAAFVFDVTVETVFPLVLALTIATRPWFGIATIVHHFVTVRQTFSFDSAQRLFTSFCSCGHCHYYMRFASRFDRLVAELGRIDHRCRMMVATTNAERRPGVGQRRGGRSGRG